ncbi:hypothetical protein HII31_10882 [Pseudocercospora fuligena]|uniref:EthD domain-containing protein n=1 Tax=Pseudocercospora fuligena TaxID=685502 RepID=A0A8H6VDY9_9PEZI|nr:hypothetical protein HII31_10882 [Pseudocercospora fuligena]
MTLKKIDHDFKNPQLSYNAKPNYQPYIKLSFYFNKLPHVSDEQFHRHWETVHADLTIAAKDFKVFGVKRYAQIHQSADLKEKARDLGVTLGIEHLDYDGCSEIWVEKWEDWINFSSSPEYAQAMNPDCKHFMAMPIRVSKSITEPCGAKADSSRSLLVMRT